MHCGDSRLLLTALLKASLYVVLGHGLCCWLGLASMSSVCGGPGAVHSGEMLVAYLPARENYDLG